MLNKMLALLLASILITPVSAKADSPYGYSVERPIPGDIITMDDYVKYEKARKVSLITSISLGVASFAAISYAERLDKRADRTRITSDVLVSNGPGLPYYYPADPGRMELKSKRISKAKAVKTAGIALGLGAICALTVNISLRF